MRISPSGSIHGPRQTEIINQYKQGQIALADALRTLSGDGRPAGTAATDDAKVTRERLLEILSELNSLVGLESVKETVREVFALIYMQQRRQQLSLKTDPVVLHMVFKGNPGTGKTTVARLLAKMFHESGLLEKGHLVEVERADLVGEYVGHTAQKTREHIKRALGGVLFIDEAYSLARGGEKDFGREAIDTLVKSMEDYRNQFIAIIAGYEREMEWFLSTNPGLPSRFPIHLSFPDYDLGTLLTIAKGMLTERDYKLSLDAEQKLRMLLERKRQTEQWYGHFSNARLVRNTIEEAIRKHAIRLFNERRVSKDQAMTLSVVDFAGEGVAK